MEMYGRDGRNGIIEKMAKVYLAANLYIYVSLPAQVNGEELRKVECL